MKEIWKDVIGYDGLYLVSNYGNIKSLMKNRCRIINGHINSNGYRRLSLFKNGTEKKVYTHQLVLTTFKHTADDKTLICNHKDGNKSF